MAFTYADILSFTGPIQTFLRNNFNSISNIFNQDYLQIEVLTLYLLCNGCGYSLVVEP